MMKGDGRFTLVTLVKVMKALKENHEERLPVNLLVQKLNMSSEVFYKVLHFLKYRGLVIKLEERGKKIIYVLAPKGFTFYDECLSKFLGDLD